MSTCGHQGLVPSGIFVLLLVRLSHKYADKNVYQVCKGCQTQDTLTFAEFYVWLDLLTASPRPSQRAVAVNCYHTYLFCAVYGLALLADDPSRRDPLYYANTTLPPITVGDLFDRSSRLRLIPGHYALFEVLTTGKGPPIIGYTLPRLQTTPIYTRSPTRPSTTGGTSTINRVCPMYYLYVF